MFVDSKDLPRKTGEARKKAEEIKPRGRVDGKIIEERSAIEEPNMEEGEEERG